MFEKALQYKHWSDQRIFSAVQQVDRGQHEPQLQFALQQLNHMTIVEELFKARLLGAPAPHESTNTAAIPQLQQLEQRNAVSNRWFQGYAAELNADERDTAVVFQFADGQAGCLTRREILFHIINHGTYHRGAIGHALDLAGGLRPADTYTAYIHEVDPSRRQRC